MMGNSPRQWIESYAPTFKKLRVEAAVKIMGSAFPCLEESTSQSNTFKLSVKRYLEEETAPEFEEEEYEQADSDGDGGSSSESGDALQVGKGGESGGAIHMLEEGGGASKDAGDVDHVVGESEECGIVCLFKERLLNKQRNREAAKSKLDTLTP